MENHSVKKEMPEIKYIKTGIYVLIIFLIIMGIKSKISSLPKEEKTENVVETSAETLMFVGTTPCSPTFNYKFRMESDGPISMKFPGIEEKIYWNGTDILENLGAGGKPGPVEILSTDPKNPNIEVRIYLVN